MQIPKVAVINDLSGLGKCSLTAAIPILSVMGVQACPLATAVYSNQTGFGSYACADLTGYFPEMAAQWEALNLYFDGIYSGFLNSPFQAQEVCGLIERFHSPDTFVLVDPVLGEGGRLYPVFEGLEMCEAITELISHADIITPNLTEACLLTRKAYFTPRAEQDLDAVWELAEQLGALGPSTVVITGVHLGADVCNIGWERQGNRRFCVRHRRIGGGYSGTGDILASILCGELVTGGTAQTGLEKAVRLFDAAIAESEQDRTEPNEGIAFEHHLDKLLWKG